jgi:hypothetical protein
MIPERSAEGSRISWHAPCDRRVSEDESEDPATAGASSGDSPAPPHADVWWVDRYVLYAARESTLWALFVVVLAHFAVFIASVGLVSARTLHPFALSICLMLVGITVWGVVAEVRRKGKAAGLTWLLLATWLLSGVAAYVGNRWELL